MPGICTSLVHAAARPGRGPGVRGRRTGLAGYLRAVLSCLADRRRRGLRQAARPILPFCCCRPPHYCCRAGPPDRRPPCCSRPRSTRASSSSSHSFRRSRSIWSCSRNWPTFAQPSMLRRTGTGRQCSRRVLATVVFGTVEGTYGEMPFSNIAAVIGPRTGGCWGSSPNSTLYH